MEKPVKCNVGRWIAENEQFFLPPVCNKLMYDDQINIMFVGGPNNRQDFHIEGGEELFLQLKGDMLLRVNEQGRIRDIVIKEGEIFLLPRAIPHSPQRFVDTVGLVVERNRTTTELDALRFYVSENDRPTTIPLYEVWFQWNENRSRMGEYFQQFFDSEQYKTGKPVPGALPDKRPIEVDQVTALGSPFSLQEWIANNRQQIDDSGRVAIFDTPSHQLKVYIYGQGECTDHFETAQTWIWQKEGQSKVIVGAEEYILEIEDSLLVPINQRFTVKQEAGSLALVCSQVPIKE